MSDQRNMILAIVLSVVILVGWEFYSSLNRPPPVSPTAETTGETATGTTPVAPAPTAGGSVVPSVPGAVTADEPLAVTDRAAVLKNGDSRVRISTPRLHGSILLRGGRIDDLTLIDYREELDPESPEIVLFSPQNAKGAYFAEHGWIGAKGVDVPGPKTVWSANTTTLTAESPVTLTWDNGQGLVFSRTYALDDDYMFTVTQRVRNKGSEAAPLFPYGLISRQGTPEVTKFFILHEGLLGVFDGTLKEVDYDDLKEEGDISQPTTGGWIGFTDKFLLAALIPDQKSETATRFLHSRRDGDDRYQADFRGERMIAEAGGTIEFTSHLFAGAKEISLLDRYEETLGVVEFWRAIDFGYLYFLTRPIFYFLIYINDYVGNFGVSILVLTILIKILFFPLANKSYKAMSKMKKLQPEMTKLRERFGDDKARLNQEMMALYKKEKANPAAGCLPMLIQIPVFFALYKVLFVTIEMRHAPFFGWIVDLSAPDPTSVWNLFGLIPWDPSLLIPSTLNIGVWPLVMGLTMFLQQKLNPQPADPLQAKIFLFLPLMFTFLLAQFPAGLVVYWAWNNTLSIIQQKIIMTRMGVK